MIRVIIPANPAFEIFKDECKKLYEQSQDKICDTNSFEFVTQETLFYMFIDEEGLLGAIYYFLDESGKLFLNAFAKRKKHFKNLECLKLSTTWFNCDIYAQAQNRMSAICLLKCGFKRVDDSNVFVKKINYSPVN